MKVSEEQRGVDGFVAEFVLQALAQTAHPAAAIEDDQRAVGKADLQATCIATVAGVTRFRSGRGASYAPESDLHSAPLRSARISPTQSKAASRLGENFALG